MTLSLSFPSVGVFYNSISSRRKFCNLFGTYSPKVPEIGTEYREKKNAGVTKITEENLELFNRFKSRNEMGQDWSSFEQLNGVADLSINFDDSSLDFHVTLASVSSSSSDSSTGIFELSPFLSSSITTRESHAFSRYKKFLYKIKDSIHRLISNSSSVAKDDFLLNSPIAMRIPIQENFSGNIDDSNPKHFCNREPNNYFSTIKFDRYVDMLVYNKNFDSREGPSLDSSQRSSSSLQDPSSATLAHSKRNLDYSYHPPKVQSILKNKINRNFSAELTNARINDTVDLDIFMKNFECFENDKFRNESGLNYLRLVQLKHYYENQFN